MLHILGACLILMLSSFGLLYLTFALVFFNTPPSTTRGTLSQRLPPPRTQADALKLAEQERDAYKKELNALELSLDITRQDLQGASSFGIFLSPNS